MPDIDAPVVTRILDGRRHHRRQGALREFLPVRRQPHQRHRRGAQPAQDGYSAGGSSSGSAVLVALGEVDMAIGGDQGGSIRMPASFCGIYGMKPTHGLVPYTGIMPIEIYVDHTGPMTATVADNALLLEVLAGPDGYDSRQINVKTHPYTKALQGDIKGLKIGLVTEGFAQANAEADVNAKVKAAGKKFESLGATVGEVSIPCTWSRRRYGCRSAPRA